jgi:hypothetical protein
LVLVRMVLLFFGVNVGLSIIKINRNAHARQITLLGRGVRREILRGDIGLDVEARNG